MRAKERKGLGRKKRGEQVSRGRKEGGRQERGR
jgi:hypothetical protein